MTGRVRRRPWLLLSAVVVVERAAHRKRENVRRRAADFGAMQPNVALLPKCMLAWALCWRSWWPPPGPVPTASTISLRPHAQVAAEAAAAAAWSGPCHGAKCRSSPQPTSMAGTRATSKRHGQSQTTRATGVTLPALSPVCTVTLSLAHSPC